MKSTIELYPFLKHRLSSLYINIPSPKNIIHSIASEIYTEPLSLDSELKITSIAPLDSLVQSACDAVEKAKKTGNKKDIERAEEEISPIFDSYCYKELESELKNLKNALELPEKVSQLELLIEQKQDKDILIINASKGIQEANGMLNYFPEIEVKSELKSRLVDVEEKLKSIYTYQDFEQMILQLQREIQVLESKVSQPGVFLDGLYEFRRNYKSITSKLNYSLISREEKKECEGRLKEIAKSNTAFDEHIISILNGEIEESIVSLTLRLISEKGYSDLMRFEEFSKYFVYANKDKTKVDLVGWKQVINETAGLFLITHAKNTEELNKGLLFFEYSPYINLGKERLEVCNQFFNKCHQELNSYQSFADVIKALQPLIDERNNKVQKVNESNNSSELLNTLKEIFNNNQKELELNEVKSKYVWLRKEKREYRSLNQIIKDIKVANEDKLKNVQIKQSNTLEINVEGGERGQQVHYPVYTL
jgi:hypothetical protein